jgi:glutathione synthase/RimK-type ligase-like ATP-grasp enzyme
MATSERQVGQLRMGDGSEIDVAEIELIWWRRVHSDQDLDEPIDDRTQLSLVNNDCRGALNGILSSCFNGKWVSSPEATDRASDKIYQLSIARQAGFRIPETLISQSLKDVQAFSDRLDGRVIVKPVVGVAGPLLFTQFVGNPNRLDPKSYRVCPAVYQEYIPGTQHIRLNCFGDQSFAAVIETSELDWRPNLNVPIRSWVVPSLLHQQVRAVLDRLGLAMGVVDLKRTPEGEFVWLEVNPQGQFLFLQPLANIPLDVHFAEYLLGLLRT